MAAGDEAAVRVRVFVDADGHNGKVGQLVVKLDQRRQLLDAGRTPCGPEVEQHYAALVAGNMDRRGAVGDGEVRSRLARLGRMRAPVAAGRKRQQQEQTGRKEPREPHIPIIRSERVPGKG